ncbi:MAPEG family protein [Roseibacterium sp. SDUM158017]|uniref:MAPEG family protein n=1 Tax=Roseicyclus salinarum TaxID=3036773 RepID=UPI00241526DC|nr:MAPEG family protein [Roseibacterium sp. SDUM158017]MDG4649915.1 MAPEG family protein [Roseibacterium sp. SDUM158017]
MTPELTVLILAALLQCVQMALYSVAGNAQAGTRAALSPRDRKVELTGRAGRLQRAMNNHFEGLILFGIAAVVIAVTGQSSDVTATAAWIYLIARVLYVPAYLFGLVPWRSLVWGLGWGATLVMLLAALV